MNRLKILILILISIQTVGLAQSKRLQSNESLNTIEWSTFTDQAFEIKYPSDWLVDTSKQMGTDFIFFSPLSDPSDPFRDNVNLLIQDLSSYNLDLEQFVDLSEEQITTQISEGEIIQSERIKTNNPPYHKMVYSGKQGKYDLKFKQYYWVINNTAYILTLTCEHKTFDTYKEVGEKILNSFILKQMATRKN